MAYNKKLSSSKIKTAQRRVHNHFVSRCSTSSAYQQFWKQLWMLEQAQGMMISTWCASNECIVWMVPLQYEKVYMLPMPFFLELFAATTLINALWMKSLTLETQWLDILLEGQWCVAVGRAVASNSRDPWFESRHWQFNLLSTVLNNACKEKRGREWPNETFV